jgi:Xaa-Pro aminopeptidase
MTAAPFPVDRLDALLHANGLDAVIATSRHNVTYLSGDYSFFFNHFEAIGVDRFSPAVVYVAGRASSTVAVLSEVERWQHEVAPCWIPEIQYCCQTASESAAAVAKALVRRGLEKAVLGIEMSFASARFVTELVSILPSVELVDATDVLESLRAVKTERELTLLRSAAEAIEDSMVTTMRSGQAGVTTREMARRLATAETERGLDFLYCAVATGTSFNRAPSNARWEVGGLLSLDSGGELDGYSGDLCRMAVIGGPTSVQQEALDQIRLVQDAARAAVRAGVLGVDVLAAIREARASVALGDKMTSVVHGMGLITHEAPRLMADAPIRYEARHAGEPLLAGMVLSIETDLKLDGCGFLKLEDALAVTATGVDPFGDAARDWTVVEA